MKQRVLIPGALFVFIAAIIFVASCSPQNKSGRGSPAASAVPAVLGGKELLEARCSVCHGTSKVTNERGNAEQWTRIVNGMMSRGAKLNSTEKDVLIEYLAKTYGR